MIVLVISTNQEAIRLWIRLGFDTIGYLQKVFNRYRKGYVDVAYRLWALPRPSAD